MRGNERTKLRGILFGCSATALSAAILEEIQMLLKKNLLLAAVTLLAGLSLSAAAQSTTEGGIAGT
jgi:hypothetical protein